MLITYGSIWSPVAARYLIRSWFDLKVKCMISKSVQSARILKDYYYGQHVKMLFYSLVQKKCPLLEFLSFLLPTNLGQLMHSLDLDRTSPTKLSSLSFAQPCTFCNCKLGQAKQWPLASGAKKTCFSCTCGEDFSDNILELAYFGIR